MIYSGANPIAEYVNGTLSKEYVYGGAGLLATIAESTVTYHHPDHLSNRAETSATAGIVRTYGHFPFGETWYETGTADKWKFTSYARDTGESNLDYASARYFGSLQGRFSSPDILSGDPGNPQSLNRFAYVANDPVNMIDPSGMSAQDPNFYCLQDEAGDCLVRVGSGSPGFCPDEDAISAHGCGTSGGISISVDGPGGGLPIPGCILPGQCPVQLPGPKLTDLLPHLPCNPLSPILDGCGFDNFANGKQLTADQEEECGRRAILSGAYAFLSDFIPTGIIDPRSGALAATVGALSEWREIITNPSVAGKVARLLTPIVGEVAGEAAIPVAGEIILGAQIIHALYEAGVAANEASKSCEQKYAAQ